MRKAVAILALGLAGCSGMEIGDFEGRGPEFRPERWFLGESIAHGIFEDRFGTVRRQFRVDIAGCLDGGTLVLDERFLYDDGEREQRTWRLESLGDNRYRGRADKVVGMAHGMAAGNAFHLDYRFDLPVGEDVWRVRFDDWMFLLGPDTLVNRATVTRWGFEIGTVFIAFSKRYPAGGDPEAPSASHACGR